MGLVIAYLVLPTGVGMARTRSCAAWGHLRAPHRRGDGSKLENEETGSIGAPHRRGDGSDAAGNLTTATTCSPQAWGWLGLLMPAPPPPAVLPTGVGMARAAGGCASPLRVLPTGVGMAR